MSQTLTLAGRYQLDEAIGEGAMGLVYRATDLTTGDLLAIKSIKQDILSRDPDMLQRFRREGEALRDLNHPNIVKLLDTIAQDGSHYLVMEFVPGGDLAGLIASQPGGLPVPDALSIALDLADALTRAHRLGIVHRDLKPANILLASDGTPRLTDFGIAHFAGQDSVTPEGGIVGTFAYLSPEACLGQLLDERADIWSFGVLLFEMLAGYRPFQGSSPGAIINTILSVPLPDIQGHRAGVSDEVADLLYRMLDKNRDARISSVRLVGAALEAHLKSLGGQTAAGVATPPAPSLAGSAFATPTPEGTAQVNNLPHQATPFIGRRAELNDLGQMLFKSDCRLITVFGPGGMGKTRLSLEAARQHLGSYSHGVYFVPLAPLENPDHILPAIAQSINLPFGPGDPRVQLLDYLREKHILMVLDNFEHVTAGAGLVGEMLNAAGGLRVVATSRARLNLGSECVYEIGGLGAPASEDDTVFEEFEAVEMFSTFARRARPDFELSEQDRPAVVRICQLVGGMPLGIELAAAWAHVLPPDEIASELESDLDFLASKREDLPARQRSVRAAFEYSWNLLDDAERDALMKLSVFRGGASRAAARHVTGAALTTLVALADKSLLKRNPDSGTFDIHELLRQFAAERLDESGLAAATRDLHAAYYADALLKRKELFKGGGQLQAVEDVRDDFENVRAMWSWAVTEGNFHVLAKAGESLYFYCELSARTIEGEAMFRAAVEAVRGQPDAPPALLAWLLNGWARMMQGGDSSTAFERAAQTAREAELLAQQSGDIRAEAFARYIQAHMLWRLGRNEEAISICEAALAAVTEAGLRWETARLHQLLGTIISLSGKPDEGFIHLNTALEQGQAQGDHWMLNNIYNNLGIIAQGKGDTQAALSYYQQSLDASRRINYRRGMWYPTSNSAELLADQGDYEAARLRHSEAIVIAQENGDRYRALYGRVALIWIDLITGDVDRAEEQARLELDNVIRIDREDFLADFYTGLAEIATHRGDWQTVRHYAELALSNRRDSSFVALWDPNWLLGRAALAGGDRDSARQHFYEALSYAHQRRVNATLTATLPAVARWLADGGAPERAVELLSLSEANPATPAYHRQQALQDLEELKGQLPPDSFSAAAERGKALDLKATVEQLLEELK